MPKPDIAKLSEDLNNANKQIQELRAENEQLLKQIKECKKINGRLLTSQYRSRILMHNLVDMALFKQEEEQEYG